MRTTPFPLPIMLDAADRKALRARAHHLDPVVMIGEAGLTRAVLEETDRALRAHELIKVRVLGDDRTQRQTMSTELCSALGCTAVQSIGKLLVLYRPRPIEENTGPHVPKKRAAQATAAPSTAARKGSAVRKAVPRTRKAVEAKPMKARPAKAASGAASREKPAKLGAGARASAGAGARASAGPGARASTGVGARASTGVGARASGAKALASAGKRTAPGARKRATAQQGSASASTQRPSRLQGSASPRGRRGRAKKS